MEKILLGVVTVLLVSCAMPPATLKKNTPPVAVKKKPDSIDYILGAWECKDRHKIGEVDMTFEYDEKYLNDGKYFLSGTLLARFNTENETSLYKLKSDGIWYFSGKDQINYKINNYIAEFVSGVGVDIGFNPNEHISKSKSYSSLLVKLDKKNFITQVHPFTAGETVCQRKSLF